MRYPAAEKLAIIRLVEQSRLPVRRTLDKLGNHEGSLPSQLDAVWNLLLQAGPEGSTLITCTAPHTLSFVGCAFNFLKNYLSRSMREE